MPGPVIPCGHQDEFLDLCSRRGVRFWASGEALPSQALLARCEGHSFKGCPPGYREASYREAVVLSVMAR